ncbi:MAG: S8 family serine peptidase [Planctomycetota bacterium]
MMHACAAALSLSLLLALPASRQTARPVPEAGPAPGLVRLPSGRLVRSDHLLVRWRSETSSESRLAAYAASGARLARVIPRIAWDVVTVAEEDLFAAKDRLSAWPGVERCEFSHACRPAYTPNDPLYPSMWAPPHIRADRAWDITKGDPSVVIAILDTGVEVVHPDLNDNMWVNPGEIPGNGQDDDQNGYVDDVHGYDFVYHDPDPNDVYGHGTGCAGIAAAEIDNSEGIVGIGPRCRLMACKCGRDDGYFFDDAVAPAFIYAADMGAKVTSNSYFGDGITPVQMDAVNYAYEKGVLHVVAAGNDNRVTIYYPAGYDACIAVASLEPNDTKSWFSNFGTWVDVVAPGNSLLTTSLGGSYGGFAGTSGACPHVAGLAGLVFSVHPDWTPDEVRARITGTCVPLIDPIVGHFTNYGVVDCEAAVTDHPWTPQPRAALVWVSPSAAPPGATVCVRATSLGTKPGTVTIGRAEAPLLSWTNDIVSVTVPSAGIRRELEVHSRFGPLRFEPFRVLAAGTAPIYGATDISIAGNYWAGSLLAGGFSEMLAEDGLVVEGQAQWDGAAYMDAIFQRLASPLSDRIELTYTRTYESAGSGAAESLYLYDFDSGSYPYGGYVQIASYPITAGQTRTDTVVITTNPERYRSYETNVYLAIVATTNAGSAHFTIDRLTVAAD